MNLERNIVEDLSLQVVGTIQEISINTLRELAEYCKILEEQQADMIFQPPPPFEDNPAPVNPENPEKVDELVLMDERPRILKVVIVNAGED